MFPRLHVNDADKGGPRAPPRNKMALYEQLSIPSSRFTTPILPHNQANGHERAVFNPSTSLPYSNERADFHIAEKRITKFASFKSGNAAGSVAECNSSARRESTKNNSCQKGLHDDENDFMVPTFLSSENALPLNRETTSVASKKSNKLHGNVTQNESSGRALGQHERTSNKRKLSESEYTEYKEKHLEQESCGNDITHSKSQSNKALNKHRSTNVDDICNQTDNEKDDALLESEDAGEISNSSNCLKGMDISPDDVVEVFGPKQFWKARRAIINQQRLFAVQVFELHRLIKVQKSLAASPHLLLEDHSPCTAPQKVPINPFFKTPSQPVVQNEQPKAETIVEKAPPIPLPPQENSYRPNYPWCYPPPAQQWLVPIMSPSEGLVYKPYSPATGTPLPNQPHFMPSFYNGATYSHPQQNYSVFPMEQNSRSSCNMSFPKSNNRNNYNSELQGSSASSPSGRGALPLFPVVEEEEGRGGARVIRVVPHNNGRSATESAARIFRSIQEGRQQQQHK